MATGSIKITPEPRLNALLVLANRTDQHTVKRLLDTLDMKGSPENVAVAPKPRRIPVVYAKAQDIADLVREVYADRMVLSQGQNPAGQGPGMVMMMGPGGGPGGPGGDTSGGPGGRRVGRGSGGQNNRADQENRISIGVDTHTNTLIVAAIDPVFEEVKQLVEELDAANAEQRQTVRVITLHRTNAAAIEKALTAFAGDALQGNKAETNNRGNNQNSPVGAGRGNNGRGGPNGQPGIGGGPFGGGFGDPGGGGPGPGGPGGFGGPGGGPGGGP